MAGCSCVVNVPERAVRCLADQSDLVFGLNAFDDRHTQYGTRARYCRMANRGENPADDRQHHHHDPVPQLLIGAQQRGPHDVEVVQQRVELDDLGPPPGALLLAASPRSR